MIILRNKNFAYYKDLSAVKNIGGSFFKNLVKTPEKTKGIGKLTEKTKNQWLSVVSSLPKDSSRRKVVDQAYRNRIRELNELRDTVSYKPWINTK